MSETDDELERIRAQKMEQLNDADAEGEAAPSYDEPVHVDGPDHLDELVAEGGVVLVDFYADWCGPCKMIEPVVAELAAETPATVAKVDVDVHQMLAGQYGVQGVPTLLLFADGEPVEKLVGARDKATFEQLIQQYA